MPEETDHTATGTDPADLTDAWQAVSALSHPHSRPVVDTVMRTLQVAIASRGIRASTVAGLRQSIRKHVRQAWTDGVHVPLARSHLPADRDVLMSIPMTLDLKRHPELVATLAQVASRIPEEAVATRLHVDRALDFLGRLPVILGALDGLDALVPATKLLPTRGPGATDADHATAVVEARRRVRATFAKALPDLVEEVADAAVRGALGPLDGTAFPSAAKAVASRPTHGARRFDRTGAQWRRTLTESLQADIVDDGLRPALDRLLRRHPGLRIGEAFHRAGDALGGDIGIATVRAGVAVDLMVRFSIGKGSLDQAFAASVAGVERRPVDADAADALLDAAVPAELDTGAHRVLRRIDDVDGRAALTMSVSGEGAVTIRAVPGATVSTWFVEVLARIAEEEGVVVSATAGQDTPLSAALMANGFVRREEDAFGVLTRDPGDPAAGFRR